MTVRLRPLQFGRRLAARLTAIAALMALAAEPAAATTTFRATFAISIGGVVVGHAAAEGRFSASGYDASIRGSTSGLTRLATDAVARLSGTGRIAGAAVVPTTYDFKTVENGFATAVHMEMRSGRVTGLVAEPGLAEAADRVPLTAGHKTGVVDPLGAFLIPLDRPGPPVGRKVCDRTVKVFDGWTRFDIRLFYKETKAVDGGSESYAGRIVVCGARFVPVAGHRPSRTAVKEMAANERMEVWLAQVEDAALMIPYRIVIGTRLGDLVVHSTRFTSSVAEQRAEAGTAP